MKKYRPHLPRDHSHVAWRELSLTSLPIALFFVVVVGLIVWLADPAPPKTITISAGPHDSSLLITAEAVQEDPGAQWHHPQGAGIRWFGAKPAAADGPQGACRSCPRARRRVGCGRKVVAHVAGERLLHPYGGVLSRLRHDAVVAARGQANRDRPRRQRHAKSVAPAARG